jgi:hypothetical protein
VFFSTANNPLLRTKLPFVWRLWYVYGSWCYLSNTILVPAFIMVPLVSVAFNVHPVLLDQRFALFASLQYLSIVMMQHYGHNAKQIKSIWFAGVGTFHAQHAHADIAWLQSCRAARCSACSSACAN